MRIPTSPTALSLEDRCGPEAARICGLVILHLQKKKKKKSTNSCELEMTVFRNILGASQLGEGNMWHWGMRFETSSLGS